MKFGFDLAAPLNHQQFHPNRQFQLQQVTVEL